VQRWLTRWRDHPRWNIVYGVLLSAIGAYDLHVRYGWGGYLLIAFGVVSVALGLLTLLRERFADLAR